jgi:hypothetical protein
VTKLQIRNKISAKHPISSGQKIVLEPLSNMLTTQSENFQKFKFEFLAGIMSSTWQAKIKKIEFTVSFTVAVRLDPVATLVDTSAVDPSSLCPDPSRATWEKMVDTARTPLSSPSSSLQAPDHRDLASTDPQHSAAETMPLQHASKAVEPGVARARRQHALRRPPIGRPCPLPSGL